MIVDVYRGAVWGPHVACSVMLIHLDVHLEKQAAPLFYAPVGRLHAVKSMARRCGALTVYLLTLSKIVASET